MSWLSIILFAVRYLPTLIKIVREIIDMIQKTEKSDPVTAQINRRRLRRELKRAREGDRTGLMEMLNSMHEKTKS